MNDDDYGVHWQSTQASCPTFSTLLQRAQEEISRPTPSGSSTSQSSGNSQYDSQFPSQTQTQSRRRPRPARRTVPVRTEEQKAIGENLSQMIQDVFIKVAEETRLQEERALAAKASARKPRHPPPSSAVPVTRASRPADTTSKSARSRPNDSDAMDVDVGERPERRPIGGTRSRPRDETMQVDDTRPPQKVYPRLSDSLPPPPARSTRNRTDNSSVPLSTTLTGSSRTTTNKALGMRPRPTLPSGYAATIASASAVTSRASFKPPIAPASARTSVTVPAPPPPPPPPAAGLKQSVLPAAEDEASSSDGDTSFGSFGVDPEIIEAICSQYD